MKVQISTTRLYTILVLKQKAKKERREGGREGGGRKGKEMKRKKGERKYQMLIEMQNNWNAHTLFVRL